MTDQESGELGEYWEASRQHCLSFPHRQKSLSVPFCVVWAFSVRSLPLIVCKDTVFLTHRLVCLELRTQRKERKRERDKHKWVGYLSTGLFVQHQAGMAQHLLSRSVVWVGELAGQVHQLRSAFDVAVQYWCMVASKWDAWDNSYLEQPLYPNLHQPIIDASKQSCLFVHYSK